MRLLCVRNEGCDDLELRKLYPQYPARLFIAVELTSAAKRAVAGSLR